MKASSRASWDLQCKCRCNPSPITAKYQLRKLGNLWALSRGAKIFDTVGISNDHVIDIHTMYLSYWAHTWECGCLFVWFCGRLHRRRNEYPYNKVRKSMSVVARCQNLWHHWHQQPSSDWHPYNLSELLSKYESASKWKSCLYPGHFYFWKKIQTYLEHFCCC